MDRVESKIGYNKGWHGMNNKPITLTKIWLIISIFLLLLASARIGWIVYHTPPMHPVAKDGVIDLSEWEFTDKETITLDGEWEFYPNTFIHPNNFDAYVHDKLMIAVPGSWQSEEMNPSGYGTYRLRVILPEESNLQYGLRMKQIATAATAYVDGELARRYGQPATVADQATGRLGPYHVLIHPEGRDFELVLHVSNYDVLGFGGIVDSIQIGTDLAIIHEANESPSLQLVVGIIYLLHSLYAFLIFFISKGKYQRSLLYFGLMLVLHGTSILIDDDMANALAIDLQVHIRILLLLFLSTLLSLLLFIKHLLHVDKQKLRPFVLLFNIFVVVIVFLPFHYLNYLSPFIMVYYLSAFIFLYRQTIIQVRKGFPDGMLVILFITSYLSNMIWGILINLQVVKLPYYPFDFIITILFIALLLIKQHLRTVEINARQTEQLQRADKIKDEFLANTSHEIRNPLHGIINIAQSVLDTEKSLTTDSQENLALLINIGKRMNFTLHDLTAVTQLKEGEIKLDKQKVNLHSVVILVINMLDFMKEGKDITLRSDIPPTFPKVIADENRLIQIIFNLVHNAIKYTEKGEILISATYEQDQCTVSVKDSGRGIDSAHLERIFYPYERLNHHTMHLETGIGIGLSVTKQLVELHGGTITFHSTSEGTTFVFTLPNDASDIIEGDDPLEMSISEQEIAATDYEEWLITQTTPVQPVPGDSKALVLLVDDDPVNIKILRQMLMNDYHVFTALSGKEALKKIEQERFDIIISDVMMPEMSGYDLTEAIREKYSLSELPILLITARNLPEDIETAFRSGANDYLVKPVNALELKVRVAALTALKTSVKESLKMEAAWLQAQIHPHFLFNTLNSIASLAGTDINRMVKLLEAFGTYLEKSFAIKNIQSEIPLSDELALTHAYVHIEKERFGDRLHVEFDVDDYLEVLIPPLSIQPLVENAIMHGVLVRSEGGTVCVSIHHEGKFIRVKIGDDGVGMDEAKVAEILSLKPSPDDGIGVRNTNRRLTQLYGKGLKIKSAPNKGTVITFRIPYQPRK